MKPVILDASVLMSWLTPVEHSAVAAELIGTTPDLVSLDIVFSEIGNAVWKSVRFAGMPVKKAQHALTTLGDLGLTIVSSRPLLPNALEIAVHTGEAVYDCLYVELARSQRQQLVTLDKSLVRRMHGTAYARHVRLLSTVI